MKAKIKKKSIVISIVIMFSMICADFVQAVQINSVKPDKVSMDKTFISSNVDYLNGNVFLKNGKWFYLDNSENKIKRMFSKSFESNVKKVYSIKEASDSTYYFLVLGKDGRLWANIEAFSFMFCFNYKLRTGQQSYHSVEDYLNGELERDYKDVEITTVTNEHFTWNLVLFEENVSRVWIDAGENIAFIKQGVLYTYGMVEVLNNYEYPSGDVFYYVDYPPTNLVKYRGINVKKIKKVIADYRFVYILMKNGKLYKILPYELPAENQEDDNLWYRKRCKVKKKFIIQKKVKDVILDVDGLPYKIYLLFKNKDFCRIKKSGKLKKYDGLTIRKYLYGEPNSFMVAKTDNGNKVYIWGDFISYDETTDKVKVEETIAYVNRVVLDKNIVMFSKNFRNFTYFFLTEDKKLYKFTISNSKGQLI